MWGPGTGAKLAARISTSGRPRRSAIWCPSVAGFPGAPQPAPRLTSFAPSLAAVAVLFVQVARVLVLQGPVEFGRRLRFRHAPLASRGPLPRLRVPVPAPAGARLQAPAKTRRGLNQREPPTMPDDVFHVSPPSPPPHRPALISRPGRPGGRAARRRKPRRPRRHRGRQAGRQPR